MAWIWNASDKSAGITVNNLNFIFGSGAGGVRTEEQIDATGKFYWEVEIVVEGGSGGFAVGIATDAHNIDNYIGGNSFLEMGFAFVLEKKIYLLNQIPEIGYRDEIEAMNPIMLEGDLNKI